MKYLNISLFVILLIGLGIFGFIFMQNDSDPDVSVASVECTVDADCGSGLTCVDKGGSQFCSDTTVGEYCDENALSCSDGSTCLDMDSSDGEIFRCTNGENGLPCADDNSCAQGLSCVKYKEGETWGRCTDSAKDSYCDTNADCADGNSCVNIGDGYKRCTDTKVGSYCDENDLTCSDGSNCVDMELGADKKAFRCTDGALFNACDGDSSCQTGLSCVKYREGKDLGRCTDGTIEAYCDTNSDCATGLTCVERGNGFKSCTDNALDSYCNPDNDQCEEDTKCELVEENKYRCVVPSQNPGNNNTVQCGELDFNSSGKVDLADFANLVGKWGKTCAE